MDYIIFIIIAYLLGSIPFALIVGKIGYKIDVREHGSGNLGATNAFRVLGTKAGIIVTLADILKGTVATVIPLIVGLFYDVEVSRLIIGIFAVLGHTYPIFAKFKGGKAVATSGGIILGVNPLLFVIMVATFILTLYLFKYVSLASMVTGVVSTIISIFLNDLLLFLMVLFLTLFVFYRHKDNIKRIKNKTEPKITWM
ncbi:glycerol-3-phosphate 1-O-acyltransferase PlsY [Pseudogracilibacillus auburnensis]|uniref:Glycerol-3-phosphate acyltransferase n=1 Tax=Pseudogracilibacillus auburnensis TaxID=1494959 RepID=A0A2V3W8V5_9BACI|nr:glycerol-3-phosphate 1-O-acyltransferase PlsY [Pseudogracilibacillus auburnensis]MBO1004596.1 glycerol-3-phosphate 1-O-acyltransferase PlsY [Pseudogracilibacillus auburnensis]PXW85149.1 acyl-phosphate glycerol-3-phosphate acyltransferase [Pseudogracilibacillus auburnensis]